MGNWKQKGSRKMDQAEDKMKEDQEVGLVHFSSSSILKLLRARVCGPSDKRIGKMLDGVGKRTRWRRFVGGALQI